MISAITDEPFSVSEFRVFLNTALPQGLSPSVNPHLEQLLRIIVHSLPLRMCLHFPLRSQGLFLCPGLTTSTATSAHRGRRWVLMSTTPADHDPPAPPIHVRDDDTRPTGGSYDCGGTHKKIINTHSTIPFGEMLLWPTHHQTRSPKPSTTEARALSGAGLAGQNPPRPIVVELIRMFY